MSILRRGIVSSLMGLVATGVLIGLASPASADTKISSPAGGAVVTGSRVTVRAGADTYTGRLLVNGSKVDEGRGSLTHEINTHSVRNGSYTAVLEQLGLTGLIWHHKDEAKFSIRAKPYSPSGMRAGVSGRKVTLRWTRGPEPDLTGYDVISAEDGIKAHRGTVGSQCSGRDCSASVNVPSAVSGPVTFGVRARRSNGSGGSMGSDKAVAGVSFPRGGGPGKVLSEGAADGSGAGTDGLPPGFEELRRQSPLALPPVSPNGGTGGGFQYPTPEPEVAAPVAGMENASAEAPPWATSVAVVLATLLAAVHLGIWVRRNRLFVPAPAGATGRAGKGHGSRSRRPVTARSGGAARSPGSAVRWIPGRGAPRGVSEQASTGGSEEHRSGDSSERDEPGSLTSRPQPAAVRLADTAEQDRRRRN